MNKTVAIVESLAIRRLRMVEIVRAHAPELECVSFPSLELFAAWLRDNPNLCGFVSIGMTEIEPLIELLEHCAVLIHAESGKSKDVALELLDSSGIHAWTIRYEGYDNWFDNAWVVHAVDFGLAYCYPEVYNE